MYRILIVDDEKIERRGICFLLKQLPYEFEVIEATNGKQALEYLADNVVDILLTDVKMPYIDGIELLQRLASENPDEHRKSIIFSGYSEFEYAKIAMKLGVKDYILKPVDPEEFKKTMDKIIGELEESEKQKNIQEETQEFMKEYMLNALLNGKSVEDIKMLAQSCQFPDFWQDFSRMMLIEVNDEFFGKIGSELEKVLRQQITHDFFYLNLNSFQSVLFFSKMELSQYKEDAKNIIQLLSLKYDQKAYISISEEMQSPLEEIRTQFANLEELMEQKFYQTDQNIYLTFEDISTDDMVKTDDDTLMKQMKQDVKMKDMSNLRRHFEQMCNKYSRTKVFSQVYVKFIFSDLLKVFYENLPGVGEKELNEEIERLYRTTDFDTIYKIVNENIEKLNDTFAKNPQMVHREIESIKNYIYENYSQDISVDMLAEKVYMAPSYLSHVFKKETGQNLSKFIKAYRMEKAKEMLEETHNKIVNISYAVGYSNVSYFCQSFREYYGISPQKFRTGAEEN